MAIHIRLAEEHDQPAWDEFALSHPDGLAYHAYAWKQAVESAYGFHGYYLMAEDGGEVVGILPLVQMKQPLVGRSLVSLPYCDLGGVLAESPMVECALLEKAHSFATKKRMKRMELRQNGALKDHDDAVLRPGDKVRMVLSLPGDGQVLFSKLKAKVRSQVKKPKREGLHARLGGLELLDHFYSIFTANMRRLGSPVHSREWMRSVLTSYGDRAQVGVVYTPAGEQAAAGIILLHTKTVSIPWASSLCCFNKMNPNMLLYWTFLEYAAEKGYSLFDFGRSSMNEGTYKFKKQWGAEPSPLSWLDYLNPVSEVQRKKIPQAVHRIAKDIWCRLPLPVCNCMGPPLRRLISL